MESSNQMTSRRNYKSMQSATALREIGEYDTENLPSSVRFMEPKTNNAIVDPERNLIYNKLQTFNQPNRGSTTENNIFMRIR